VLYKDIKYTNKKYFDKVATGFHLKEYTNTELIKLFRKVGFSKIYIHANVRRVTTLFTIKLYERLLSKVPHSLRKRIISWLPLDSLLYIVIVGKKQKFEILSSPLMITK
jgi:hypothetical protein